MGGIKGAIDADYSKYVEECAKAEAGLAKIAAQGKSTETSLVAMENSVASGNVSKAIEKTVASVDKAGTSAKASATGFGQLADAGRVADKTLAQFGVSIGPTIGTLDELAKVSGQSIQSLGKLGTAFSVAGAAAAGWQVGRWIAELTGSDEKIGNFTASLLGMRDAGQAGANNADVLARAYAKTGIVFTDVHQASEALRKAQIQNAAQFTNSAALVTGWETELSKARGGVAALKGEIDAGNMTMDAMKARFVVSAEAIDYLKRNMALAKSAIEEKARADEKAAAAADAHAEANRKLRDTLFGTDQIEKANAAITAIGGIAGVSRMAADQQAALHKTVDAAIESLKRAGGVGTAAMNEIYIATLPLPPITAGLGAEWNSVGEKVSANADKIIGKIREITAAEKAYEAETQRMADEWNKTQKAVDKTKESVDDGKSATQAWTLAVRDLTGAAQLTTHEMLQAALAVDDAYRKAGIFVNDVGSAASTMRFQQAVSAGVMLPTSGGAFTTAMRGTPTSTQPWGNTLNVNVNSTDAQQIAEKLTSEMRHQGIRF
jgi:hypothetical protein